MKIIENKPLLIGLSFIAVLVIMAFFAHALSPYAFDQIDAAMILQPPSINHLFGTDQLGRDVLSRMMYGARISLSVGLIAVGIATIIGVIVGSIAGYYGGIIDR